MIAKKICNFFLNDYNKLNLYKTKTETCVNPLMNIEISFAEESFIAFFALYFFDSGVPKLVNFQLRFPSSQKSAIRPFAQIKHFFLHKNILST
jgi:hypothetical protein